MLVKNKEYPGMTEQRDDIRDISSPVACMQRVQRAISAHDLEAMTACFEHDYESQFPAHPDRAFTGHSQMRKNWSQIFAAVPDIQATLIRCTAEGDTAWAEWEWKGARLDGTPFLQRGVTVQGVPRGRIKWVRLYIEPVVVVGAGSDAAARRITSGSNPNE